MELRQESVELTAIAWDGFDELRVRGAGPVFETDNELYRPAQISQEYRYGDGVVFYQVDASDSYNENLVGVLLASDLSISEYYVDGLHTYCISKKFEVIDIRCGVIDYFKPAKKVLGVLKR